jgi:hypothetical protein
MKIGQMSTPPTAPAMHVAKHDWIPNSHTTPTAPMIVPLLGQCCQCLHRQRNDICCAYKTCHTHGHALRMTGPMSTPPPTPTRLPNAPAAVPTPHANNDSQQNTTLTLNLHNTGTVGKSAATTWQSLAFGSTHTSKPTMSHLSQSRACVDKDKPAL